jgi:hypothetical protein
MLINTLLAIAFIATGILCQVKTAGIVNYLARSWAEGMRKDPFPASLENPLLIRLVGILFIGLGLLFWFNVVDLSAGKSEPQTKPQTPTISQPLGAPQTPYHSSNRETYTSHFFDFELLIPTGWDIQAEYDDRNLLESVNQVPPAAATDQPNPQANHNSLVLLHLLRHLSEGKLDRTEQLTCISADMSFLQVTSAAQYLRGRYDAARRKAEAQGFTIQALTQPASIRLDKVEFLYQDLSISVPTGTVENDRQFVAVIKKRVLVFSLMYERAEQLNELMGLLHGLKFMVPVPVSRLPFRGRNNYGDIRR